MRYLLDTNILIYFLDGMAAARDFFKTAEQEKAQLFYSFLTRLELQSLASLSDEQSSRSISFWMNCYALTTTLKSKT